MIVPPSTLTFWPMMQRSPMRAPFMTWEKCQILVPAPISAPRRRRRIRARSRAARLPALLRAQRFQFDRSIPQRALAGVEHPQHAEPFAAVADRRVRERHSRESAGTRPAAARVLRARPTSPSALTAVGIAILPFDPVRIQHQLVSARVVEHRHLLRPDHHQPLFLDRMQPAHEDVGLHAAGELEMAQRDVRDVVIQVSRRPCR